MQVRIRLCESVRFFYDPRTFEAPYGTKSSNGNVLSDFDGAIGSGNEMFYDGVGNRTSMKSTSLA